MSTVVGGAVRGDAAEIIVGTYSGFVLGLGMGELAPEDDNTRARIDTSGMRVHARV